MSRRVTLMIIPEGSRRVFSRTFRSSFFKFIVAFLALWVIALVVVTFFYSRMSFMALKASMLEEENHNLRGYLARVVDIEKSFKQNRELTARLAQMAGVDLEDFEQPERINFDSALAAAPDTGSGDITGSGSLQIPLTREELAKQTIPSDRPLYGWITRAFSTGEKSGEKHAGVDFAVKTGTTVAATASGIVKFAGWDEYLGNLVIIDHGNGHETLYGHNGKLLVEEGDNLLKGDVIALSGNTGHSTAPHLHYEIQKDGVPVDPTPYLD